MPRRATNPDARPRRRSLTEPLWIGLCFVVAACVSTAVEDSSTAGLVVPSAVVLPVNGGNGVEQGALTDYYSSILWQMQDAILERSVEGVLLLLAQHDRADAPAWARESMQRFRDLTGVLEFELHLEKAATLRIEEVGGAIAASRGVLGKPALFVLELKSAPVPVRLTGDPGSDGGAKLRFSFVITDTDCFGNRTFRETSRAVALPKTVDFGQGESLRLPFGFDLEGAQGCVRTVKVRVQLMPGYVQLDGVDVPNRFVTCADQSFVFYPPGIKSVETKPFTTLKEALRRAERKYFSHIYLAAHFIPDDFREDASQLLIDSVRNGRADQGRVAMASLGVLTGEPYSVEDRTAWLEWWQRRHSK